MGIYHTLRKKMRGPAKTVLAVKRWKRISFDEAPVIFGNAKPKSGSHLLLQILNGFCQVMPYRYVEEEPVRTVNKDGGRRSSMEILTEIRNIQKGVIGWGYVDAVT